MTNPDDEPKTTPAQADGGPTADPDSPLFDDEGDMNQDRQDPPRPSKTEPMADEADGDDPPLDGMKPTPGDSPAG